MRIDLAQGEGTISGFGIPTGGTANQVLSKVNSTNFNTQWVDATSEFTSFTASTNITRGYAVRLRDNGTIIATNTISGETFPIIGIAQQSGTTGSTVQVAVESNISEVHTGLLPGYNYYTDDNGLITTTGDTYVGVALSPTQINVSFSNPGGITTPSLNVIDNTITNPNDITTPGRYIVPVSGLTGSFVGNANDYADYDGSSFTFTLPTNGDKASIATGPNAGNVYLFTSGATSGWTLSSQVTTLPTSNWTIGGTYKQNDLVIYQNVLYQANGNIPANTAFVIGTSGLTWKQIGYGNVISENGSTIIANNPSIGTTVVDIATFTLPSAGTYEITQIIRAEISSATGIPTTFLTNSSNVVVPDSQVIVSFSRTGQSTVSQVSYITTTGPQTFKVRGQCLVSGVMGILSDNSGVSKVSWNKISGFLPSTGSISNYINTRRTGGAQLGISGGTDLILSTVGSTTSGIPYNTTTGVYTLQAGVTYELSTSLKFSYNDPTNAYILYAWVDTTTNTQLGGMTLGIDVPVNRNTSENGSSSAGGIYTPSTNQTIKLRAIEAVGTVNMGESYAIVKQLGTTNVSQFVGALSNSWVNGNTYPSGTLVVNNRALYQANNTIPAGTGFNIGTTGNTWSIIGQGNTAEYLQVGKSTAQTFVQGSNTITNFATPTINTLVSSTWNGTTGTFTAGKSVTYRIWGSFIVNSVADLNGDYYSLSVQRNGTTVAEQIQIVYSTATIFKPNLLLPSLIQCNVGDVIRFRWFQTMNGNRNNTASEVQNYIVIEEVPTRLPI